MTRATDADVEDLEVSSSPAFRAIMERSEARYRADGGLSTEEVRSRLAARCEAAWAAEVGRRLGELHARKAKLIPWARVRRRLEAAVARGRKKR